MVETTFTEESVVNNAVDVQLIEQGITVLIELADNWLYRV
jgi:hypothetical protein